MREKAFSRDPRPVCSPGQFCFSVYGTAYFFIPAVACQLRSSSEEGYAVALFSSSFLCSQRIPFGKDLLLDPDQPYLYVNFYSGLPVGSH